MIELLPIFCTILMFTSNITQFIKSFNEKQVLGFDFKFLYLSLFVALIWFYYSIDKHLEGMIYSSIFLVFIWTTYTTMKLIFEFKKFKHSITKHVLIIFGILISSYYIPIQYSIIIANVLGILIGFVFLYSNFKNNTFKYLSIYTISQLSLMMLLFFIYGLLKNDVIIYSINLFNLFVNSIVLYNIVKLKKIYLK